VLLSLVILSAQSNHALAGRGYEYPDFWSRFSVAVVCVFGGYIFRDPLVCWWEVFAAHPKLDDKSAKAFAQASTTKLTNFGAGREPGEPDPGGIMRATIWSRLALPFNARVVLHTFGSDFDTGLAVYTGDAVDALTLVPGTFNDNTAAPGLSTKQSLAAFDAHKDEAYSIQIGSKTGAEGDVYLNMSILPPTGGLSAWLADVNGVPAQGKDYACLLGFLGSLTCGAPTFVLHNSSTNALKVKATSDLDGAFAAPAEFTLKPGAVKTAQFAFNPGFERTVRTIAGSFIFTGSSGGKVVTLAQQPAVIVVKGSTPPPDVLRAEVKPAIRAGFVNVGQIFDVKLTNTGSVAAVGCHARARNYGDVSRLRTAWREIDPDTNEAIGPYNLPLTLAPGQSRLIRVVMASQQGNFADPAGAVDAADPNTFDLDCANTQVAPIDLTNSFGVTAAGMYRPATVIVSTSAPKVLKVPARKPAVFTASIQNKSATATLRALPRYVRPFGEDDPGKQFQVTICPTEVEDGACLQPPSPTIDAFVAKRRVVNWFKIFVRAPSKDPGFDPGKRRMFLNVDEAAPFAGTFDARLAAPSVAVKKIN
jgi:hypothetical protein